MKDITFLTEFSKKSTTKYIHRFWSNFLPFQKILGSIVAKNGILWIKNELNNFLSNIMIKLDKNFKRKLFFRYEIKFFKWNKKCFMKKLQNKLEKKLKPFPFKNIGEVIILELEIKYHSCLKEYLN
jgi:hypothetical protein